MDERPARCAEKPSARRLQQILDARPADVAGILRRRDGRATTVPVVNGAVQLV